MKKKYGNIKKKYGYGYFTSKSEKGNNANI